MDLESTYGEWLAERIANELCRREAIPEELRERMRLELVELEHEGWWFAPPER